MKAITLIFFAALQLSLGLRASTVEVSGGNPPPVTQHGIIGAGKPVVVGTFAANFDPLKDIRRYGDDSGNFDPSYYFRMVGAGDFQPIGEMTTTGSGQFSGLFLAPDLEGRRLWLVVWDAPDKGNAMSGLVSSLSRDNWLLGRPGTTTAIDLSEADTGIFADMRDGQFVSFILPMPEPGPLALAAVGAGYAFFFRPSKHKRNGAKTRKSEEIV